MYYVYIIMYYVYIIMYYVYIIMYYVHFQYIDVVNDLWQLPLPYLLHQ